MTLLAIWPADPPGPDEVEASLFGPGRGESCVVHVGDGKWIVVDSCIDQRSRLVPALDYLHGIGVDVASDVEYVVATHAHQDHVAGISAIFEACTSARFVMPQALSSSEYTQIVRDDTASGVAAGVHGEYRRIFSEIQRRGRHPVKPLVFASPGRHLMDRRRGDPADVVTLSPSDEAFERSLRALRAAGPAVGDARGRWPRDINDCAIALWVETEDVRLLLGADLLAGPAGCGWEAVISTHAPVSRASYVKVPHHGAPNAHHDGMWDHLLSASPVAVLTPFRGGRNPSPADADVARLLSRTPRTYATAGVRPPVMSRKMQQEAREIGVLASAVRDPWGECGQVRARFSTETKDWDVTTYGPARLLTTPSAS